MLKDDRKSCNSGRDYSLGLYGDDGASPSRQVVSSNLVYHSSRRIAPSMVIVNNLFVVSLDKGRTRVPSELILTEWRLNFLGKSKPQSPP